MKDNTSTSILRFKQFHRFASLGYMLYVAVPCLIAQTSNTGEFVVTPNTRISMVNDFLNTNSGIFVNNGDAFFYGGIANEGMFDYVNADSQTRFVGSGSQIISGSEPIFTNDLLVANDSRLESAVAISGELQVDRLLDFSEGIVNTADASGKLIIESTASVINESNDSHVDGFIDKLGSTDFTFPVGDGGFYRFATLQNQQGRYSVRYVLNDPEETFPLGRRIGNGFTVSDEYWVVENDISELVLITISWDELTTTLASIVTDPDFIRLMRWDFEQEAWVEQIATVNFEARTVSSRQTIDGRAVFAIAGADEDIILPDGVIVWNAISPNGDGKNDYLLIENLEQLPNNEVTIYNRWGAIVFQTTDYDSNGNVFTGFAEGNDNRLLPSGTYFYVLAYDGSDGSRIENAGYIEIATD